MGDGDGVGDGDTDAVGTTLRDGIGVNVWKNVREGVGVGLGVGFGVGFGDGVVQLTPGIQPGVAVGVTLGDGGGEHDDSGPHCARAGAPYDRANAITTNRKIAMRCVMDVAATGASQSNGCRLRQPRSRSS